MLSWKQSVNIEEINEMKEINVPVEIGTYIAIRRKKLGLEVKDLMKRIEKLGGYVSDSYISKIETNSANFSSVRHEVPILLSMALEFREEGEAWKDVPEKERPIDPAHLTRLWARTRYVNPNQ